MGLRIDQDETFMCLFLHNQHDIALGQERAAAFDNRFIRFQTLFDLDVIAIALPHCDSTLMHTVVRPDDQHVGLAAALHHGRLRQRLQASLAAADIE